MKRTALFLLLYFVTFIIFISCNPSIVFDQPQPQGVRNEKNFPKKLIGHYFCTQNHSTLFITHDKIIKKSLVELNVLKSELDSMREYKLFKDTLIDILTQKRFKVEYRNDTIVFFDQITDTLFMLSDENILRKWKGYYFLNEQSKNGWIVRKLEYKRGGKLILASIVSPDELENLKEVMDIEKIKADDGETIGYRVRHSKLQLKRFIRNKGFSDFEEY